MVVLRFLFLVATKEPHTWHMDAQKPWHKDWRTLSYVLIISSIGIMASCKHYGVQHLILSANLLSVCPTQIRCVYRVTELSQGYRGHLATTEAFFYGLDSLPLLIAVAVYVPFWPARMIPGIDQLANVDKLGRDGEKSRVGSDSEDVNP